MLDKIKTVIMQVAAPNARRGRPDGVVTIGHYRVEGNEVVMTGPDGQDVIGPDGQRYRGKFGDKSGELSEKQIAGRLTKDIRAAFRHDLNRRPDGFGSPISYERDGSCY